MTDLQSILDDLAAGRITTDEASRRISSIQDPDNEFPAYSPPPPPKGFSDDQRRGSAHATGNKGVERLQVRGSGRRIRVEGDPSVATVSIDGPHLLRRNGKVLEITSEGSLAPSFDGLGLLRSRNLKEARDNAFGGKELVIRANPSLLVEVELSGGSLITHDVAYLGQVRVTGGSATLEGVAECADVLVQAGQAVVTGTFRSGRSRIRVESGRGVIELGAESNVTVRSDAQLGRVAWSGAHSGGGDEVVLGLGNARLDLEAVMAYVSVKAG